nr:DUF397 domain-containing protein [Spirillospora albida]
MDLSSAKWRKSARSDSSGGDCVEVAGVGSVVAVRDSRDPDGSRIVLVRDAFIALARDIRSGRHDR